MANRRFIDFPIASTVGDNDIVLIWQDGMNKQTTKGTLIQGAPTSLEGLTDVDIAGLINGQILQYNSTTGKWENVDRTDINLSELGDVSIVSPTNGQVLVYNSSTSKWENSSGGYVPYTGAVTTVNLGAQSILAGTFVKAGGTSSQFLKADGSVDSTAYGTGSVTSVGLTMPSAFNVANSPVTTAGTLAVTGAGTVSQYIRGDGSLADFPSSTGGGASVNYYLNGSVSQGTIGGVAYKELNKTPVLGTGTDFTINANGYIASFITDAGDPNKLEIPAGNWNFETYFSASSAGGSPSFYIELYKYDGSTFTLIASSSTNPELIAFGTTVNAYFSTLTVPPTTLALTDRLAIRIYVTHSGRTITLHTEDNNLCQVITTFTTGLTALNGLTSQVQFFAVGTSGSDFNIASSVDTHTFNLPTASASNRGALSSADWSTFNGKQNALTLTTTGTSGAATLVGSTLNIPQYQAAGTYVTAVTASSPLASSGGTTPNITIQQASGSQSGFLSSTDWTTFNNKQNALGYTPVPETRTLTINGTTQDLSANRTYNVGDMLLDTVQTVTARKDFNTNTLHLVVNGTSQKTVLANSPIDSGSYSASINFLGFNASNNLYFSKGGNNNGIFAFNNASTRTYTLKDASGTLAFTSDIPANPVGGTGTTNYLPKFTGSTTIGNSQIFDNGTNVGIGTGSTGGGRLNILNIASNPVLSIRSQNNVYEILTMTFDESTDLFSITNKQAYSLSGIAFGTNNTERVRIAQSGNLLVGTTTDAGYKLDVNGTGRFLSGSSSTIGLIVGGAGGAGATRQGQLRFGDAGSVYKIQGGEDYSAFNFMIGSGTPLSLASNGAATFSSSLTAGGLLTTAYASAGSSMGQFILNTAGSTLNNSSDIWFGTWGGSTIAGITNARISALNVNAGNAATDLLFYTFNGSSSGERMRITSGGNVGIGTASPYANLDLGATGANNIILRNTTSAYNLGYIGNAGGRISIGFSDSNSSLVVLPYLSVLSSGNVGIGTSSPNANLHLKSSSGSTIFRIEDSAGVAVGRLQANAGDGNINLFEQSGYALTFGTSNSERIRITSGGNVLIGTTTDVGARLHVNGAVRTGAPSGGSAVDWRLGTARGGTITPNAIVRVEIGGVLVDLDARYV
jgi:hypothetical protein